MIVFSSTEVEQILLDCVEIDMHLTAVQEHMNRTGTVVPMRTLGHWEEMRLDQREVVHSETNEALQVATAWPEEKQ